MPKIIFDMKQIDFLFIYVPKWVNWGVEKHQCALLPGVLALADFLNKNNFSAKIIHLGLEKYLNPDFSLIRYLSENKVRIVGLSLHWHFQSYDVIEVAKNIKKELPYIKIVLGGFTASFFDKEIMENFKFVDFIIRGDAEKPLLALTKCLKFSNKVFGNIPNLTHRKEGVIIRNKHNYVANNRILNQLCYSNLELLKNFKEYFEYIKKTQIAIAEVFKIIENKDDKVFIYHFGRGCSVNCSFCGGSNLSQRIINNRFDIAIKTRGVIRDFKRLVNKGVNHIYACFDPCPDERYFIKLFKKIRKEKIRIKFSFEPWQYLPSTQFIDEFKKTFLPGSTILLSPDSGSEIIRKKNRGVYFSNKDLIKTISQLSYAGIPTKVYFTMGLAFEKEKDLIKTIALITYLQSRFSLLKFNVQLAMVEPASPWSLRPRYFGLQIIRKTFMDYFYYHKISAKKFQDLLGGLRPIRSVDFLKFSGYRSRYLKPKQIIKWNLFFRQK